MTRTNKLSKYDNIINEIRRKNYNTALNLLSKIQSNSDEIHLENKLFGSIYFKKKNWMKSIEYFKKILKNDSKDLVVLNNIGVALYNTGKFEEAINFFEKLSIYEENSVNAFKSLGISYKNIGNYEKAIEYFLKSLNIDNNDLIKQNLIDIFNYYIPKETKNYYFLNLNKEILNINNELNLKKKFDEKNIKKFIEQNFDKLDNLNLDYKETQIFRRNTVDLNCDRHFKVFNKYKIIPKYCFDCYKIQIDVINVINLIKLFFIFNKINLKNNNIRKCVIETRNKVIGNYKGYVFCTGLNEARELIELFSNEIKEAGIIIKEIKIKHGCTEFYKEYPEYEEINYNGEQKFKYQNNWKKKEGLLDERLQNEHVQNEKVVGPTINKINLSDILIIRNWLAYACLIEDKSYTQVFSKEIKSNFISETIKDQINFRKNY